MDFDKTSGKTISCQAAVAWEKAKPYVVETVEVAVPRKGEVRVKIVASGLCQSDLSIISGTRPDQKFPYIPGHEGGAIVESIGEGVTTVKPGDKVLTFLLSQCRKCPACQDTRNNLCADFGRANHSGATTIRNFGYDGTTRFTCKGEPLYFSYGISTFSQYTIIPENSCVKVDSNTVLEKACIISCGFTTGYATATNLINIRPSDAVAVWGLGGVGLAAVVGCKDGGAKHIIGVDVNSDKEQMARKLGCTDFVNLSSLDKSIQEVLAEKTSGGLDYAIVCVGNAQAMENAIQSTKPGATTVIVGLADSKAVMKVSPLFLLSNRRIIGGILGGYKILDDIPKLVKKYVDGQLPIDDFVTHKFKLDQINEAVDLLRAGKCIRAVVTP